VDYKEVLFERTDTSSSRLCVQRAYRGKTALQAGNLLRPVLPPISAYLDPADDLKDGKNDSMPSGLFGKQNATEDTAITNFFHSFEAVITQAGSSIPESLSQYIRYSQLATATHAHIRMLSALEPHLNLPESSATILKLREARRKTCDDLKGIEAHVDTYREACWREGHDVGDVD
jgi:hypothetical protein